MGKPNSGWLHHAEGALWLGGFLKMAEMTPVPSLLKSLRKHTDESKVNDDA